MSSSVSSSPTTMSTTTNSQLGITIPNQWHVNNDQIVTLPTIQYYGWKYQDSSTVDKNYMDLAFRLARNSYCLEGNMGTVFVTGIPIGGGSISGANQNTPENYLNSMRIVAVAINTALVRRFHSEGHAEANAVSACSGAGVSLKGTSCYVTRAPCMDCFRLLATAGVERIICPQCPVSEDCTQSIRNLGIEWVTIQESQEDKEKRDKDCKLYENVELVQQLRKERKLVREAEKSLKTKRKLERQKTMGEKWGSKKGKKTNN